jgi:adenylate cyclase
MEALVRLPGLFLIGQDSMFTFKETATTPRDVAREVGVRHVLEGSVRWAERHVRVSARLVEAATVVMSGPSATTATSRTFSRCRTKSPRRWSPSSMSAWWAERTRVLRQHLRSADALALLYRGVELMHRFTREDMVEARDTFESLARMEPDSPIPHVDLAWTHCFEVERGWSEDPVASLERMSGMHRSRSSTETSPGSRT